MIVYGVSDKGIVRRSNQDAFRIRTEAAEDLTVAVLCDGMGGAKSGEVASSIAAEAFLTAAAEDLLNQPELDITEIGRESAALANLRVFDRAQRDDSCAGMGTTLVALMVRKSEAALCRRARWRGWVFPMPRWND